MARISTFSTEYIEKVKSYLESCKDDLEKKIVKIPTIEGLAVYLNINRDTIYDWCEKFEEFSDIIDTLRAQQGDRLLNNGLAGTYNSTIAKVLLTKHGYREGIDSDLTSKGEKIEGINYIIPNEADSKANI